MRFDSATWRVQRDEVLQDLLGDASAVAFFIGLSNFTEVVDDLVDRDKAIDKAEMFEAMRFVLCELPFNPFFQAFDRELRGQMVMALNGWFESERLVGTDRTNTAMAFTLRNLAHEMLFAAAIMLQGYDTAHKKFPRVRAFLINDTFDEYEQEHSA